MASRPTAPRPLSPHLSIWKWRVHMVVSILHRATGQALAFGAVLIFLWWLLAAASGVEAYRTFQAVVVSPLGAVVGVGLTWVLFQHIGSGIRHFIMDAGEGYDLATSRRMGLATFGFSALATILTWLAVLYGKGY